MDNYVFHDMSVLDITADVLKDFPEISYRFDTEKEYKPRSYTTQFRANDYFTLVRLWAEEGINFYFEHVDDHASAPAIPSRTLDHSPDTKTGHAKHILVLFDNNDTLQPNAQPEIRYHRTSSTGESDAITHFSEKHQIGSNAVSIASWDYKKLVATSSADSIIDKPENVPVLEVYQGAGAYQYTDDEEAARIARIRTEALHCRQITISRREQRAHFSQRHHLHPAELQRRPARHGAAAQ